MRSIDLTIQVFEPAHHSQIHVAIIAAAAAVTAASTSAGLLGLARANAVLDLRHGCHDLLQRDPVRRQQRARLAGRVDEALELLLRDLHPPPVVLGERPVGLRWGEKAGC